MSIPATKPLTGMRILAVEQFGAGPYGSMFLADLGAEVIKIENPAVGGDAARHVGPHLLGEADGQYFQSVNFNKRSVTLDIKSASGREAFRRLAASADAVLNNLRGDLPEALGIDYASLKAVNPAIVCLHISAYGRDNSRKGWPGYDYLMQAEAGMMSVTGEPDGVPCRTGSSIVDFMTGMTGMVGLLSAIIRAKATGAGCDVDVCLFDIALHQLSYPGTWYLNGGAMPTRQPRSAHPSLGPVGTYRTADGFIFLMCMKDKFFEALIEKIGAPALGRDPRFATMAGRREHRDALTQELDKILMTRTTAEWLDVLSGAVPCAPVNDVAQVVNDAFVATTGMIRTVPHPRKPDFRALANPLKINGERLEQKVCSALGADNADLLDEAATAPRRAAGSSAS